MYFAHLSDSACKDEGSYTDEITTLVSHLVIQFTTLTSDDDLDSFRERSKQVFESEVISHSGFTSFMESLAQQHDTVKFWYQFITADCVAYNYCPAYCLRNWELRVGSLKLLAATFSAFDRPIYQELIPHHLKDVLTMPPNILHHLRKKSFTVRLSPSEFHSVALDKCHEMNINKDAMLAVIHPSKHKMEFLSNYLSFRAACDDNLKKQVLPECARRACTFSHSLTSRDVKRDINIQYMLDAILSENMLTVSGLWNLIENAQATPLRNCGVSSTSTSIACLGQ